MRAIFSAVLILLLAQAANAAPTASLLFQFDGGERNGELHIKFSREDSSEEKLVVASVNLGTSAGAMGINPPAAPVIEEVSPYLQGWFIVQQSQELWLGTKMSQGQKTSNQIVALPNVFSKVDSDDAIYDLNYIVPTDSLLNIASRSDTIDYAKVDSVEFVEPGWGRVVQDSSNDWTEVSPGRYKLNNRSEGSFFRIRLQKFDTKLAIWLRTEMPEMAIGLMIGVAIFLAIMYKFGFGAARYSAYISALVVSVLMVTAANFQFDIKTIFFDLVILCAIFLVSLFFALFPENYIINLKRFIDGLRDHGSFINKQ